MDQKLKKVGVDVKTVRGMFPRLDHYAILAKIRVKGRLEYNRSKGEGEGK